MGSAVEVTVCVGLTAADRLNKMVLLFVSPAARKPPVCAASGAGKRQELRGLQAQHWQAEPPREPGQPAAALPEGK